MSPFETINAAYAALGRNDPSVLFAAMDPAITWNEAIGNPLADRNPYVGPQAVGEGVFARLLAAIDNFTAVPSTIIDGGDRHRGARNLSRRAQGRRRGTRCSESSRVSLPRRQGGDVPAVYGHCTVGAATEVAAQLPRRRGACRTRSSAKALTPSRTTSARRLVKCRNVRLSVVALAL